MMMLLMIMFMTIKTIMIKDNDLREFACKCDVILVMTMSFGALCSNRWLCSRGIKIDTYRSMNCFQKVSFFQENRLAFELEGVKKWLFFKKNKKKVFFSPLVSDHVVTLNTFTVRAHFFNFPIDFFGGLPPSLYADEVLCAASRAALPPHILFGWRKNRKWRNSMQVGETLFLCNRCALPPPYSIRVAQNYRYFATKKSEKNMSTTNAKIELSFEPELNFCNFWGLQNEPPKALWTPTWLQHFS